MVRVLLGFLLLSGVLNAADPTGTLTGTVLDPGGALVPAAKITVTNTQTGLTRTMESAADGGFVFPLLPAGSYKIAVEATGFSVYQQTGLVIAADQSITVPVRVKIGATSETVEVTAGAEMVETRSGALSNVVNERKIVDLPLNGRNAAALMLL